MPADLGYLDRLDQRFRRSGTSLFIETYERATFRVVDSFECQNCPSPTPSYVQQIAADRINHLSRLSISRYLPYFSAAVEAMRAGGPNARILHVGDSTTQGRFANGQAQWVDCRKYGFPAQFAALLQGFAPTYDDNLIGIGVSTGLIADFLTADPKFTVGGGTSISQNAASIGGGALSANSAVTVYTYTPSVPVDTWNVGYIQNTGYGTFAMLVDGVQVGPLVDGNGANVLAQATRTFPLGNHTLSIVKQGTGLTRPLWIRTWDSTKPGIESMSGGFSGQNTTNIADTATFLSASYNTSGAGYLGFLAPHLVTLNLGINDYGTGIATATTKSNLQTFCDAVRAQGADIIGIIPNPSSTSAAALSTQYATLAALRQFYSDNGIMTVDFRSRYGTTYESALARGWMLPADPNHPVAAGHAQGALALYQALFSSSSKV